VERLGVDGFYGVVNLAGERVLNFLRPMTAAFRQELFDSRVKTTEALARAISRCAPQSRPHVFVATSATGIYPASRDAEYAEDAKLPEPRTLPEQICVAVERAAVDSAAQGDGVRRVQMRLGVVLGREGGAFAEMRLPFKLGLGGPFGDGSQWFPWVHIDDAVAAYAAALSDERLAGPVNVVAPQHVTNLQFVRALGKAMRRPAILPVPGFALRLALQERAAMLLEGQRVTPRKLLDAGLRFAYADIDSAVKQLAA
jgi:uncharacterized protein (TIGR01777 family)